MTLVIGVPRCPLVVTDDLASQLGSRVTVGGAHGVRRLAHSLWPASRRLRRAGRHAFRGQQTQAAPITDGPTGFEMARVRIAPFSRPVKPFMEERR